MSETRTIDPTDLICNLKAVAAELECQHHMELLKKQAQPPVVVMIPTKQTTCRGEKIANSNKDQDNKHHKNGNNHRQCPNEKQDNHKKDNFSVHSVKSRELRAGILYTGCGCLHRDGLQDSCPRTGCQGQPECITKPWPECQPSKLFRARHPEIYPIPL